MEKKKREEFIDIAKGIVCYYRTYMEKCLSCG